MVEYSVKRRKKISRGERGNALQRDILASREGQAGLALGDNRSYRIDESKLDARSAAVLRERVVERKNLVAERHSLGLEPYLDKAFATYEESTCCDIAKYPKHRWRPPSQIHEEGVTRGKISGFSRKSRFRLMKRLAECRKGESCLFMTLTVPFDWEADVMKEKLWAYFRRIERKYAASEVSMVWKIEPHKKGNWHFHCIIYGLKFFPHRIAKAMWQDVIGSKGIKGAFDYGVDLKHVKSGDVSAVRNYVMKYMSKECDGEDFGKWSGRVWGVRGNLPRGKRLEAGMSWHELKWLWRMISRKRKRNVVKMNTTFFSEFPEIWLVNARILAKINEL